MEFPFILSLFILLTIVIGLAWWGKRRLSITLFCIFLIIASFVLWHHMTDTLTIEL